MRSKESDEQFRMHSFPTIETPELAAMESLRDYSTTFCKGKLGPFQGTLLPDNSQRPSGKQNPQLFAQATNFPNLGKPGYLTLLWLSKLKACPFPRASVILCWKSCKCPTAGLKNRVQMPHPGTTPKLHFPASKLQIPLFIGNL